MSISISHPIRIGTRGSDLALWQARAVRDALKKAHDLSDEALEITVIKTTGDRITDRALLEAGGKGLFTKEIEEGLLDRSLDLAVHSAKDMPTRLPDGLVLAAYLERADIRDALIAGSVSRFDDLPDGAVIGTCSLRRRAQLLALRPDLQVADLRGNLDTRLRKVAEGTYDAIVLACAGIRRLGRQEIITEILDLSMVVPAVGQGALCVEIRENNPFVEALLAPIHDLDSERAVRAERALMRELEGGCQVPVGGHAKMEKGVLVLYGVVASLEGDKIVRAQDAGKPEEPEQLGERVAGRLLAMGAKEILDDIRGNEECQPSGN